MREQTNFIGGAWCAPTGQDVASVVNPATEQEIARIRLGSRADVNAAVLAAREAFADFCEWTVEDRVALLHRIGDLLEQRLPEMGAVISDELGAPIQMATTMQAGIGLAHFRTNAEILARYSFETPQGKSTVRHEPIGVCGLITPWNWPLNQMACKIAPALAAGCTMVLKPSEVTPLSSLLLTEILHEAGVPPGVFNLVQGSGAEVGQAICEHPEIDMVSFTGSTRAGIEVARAAAGTVKRVSQELGGKSANILVPGADLQAAVTAGVEGCLLNSGQTCKAPTRMFVQQAEYDEACRIAVSVAENYLVGDPRDPMVRMGPVVSAAQFSRIQSLIESGIQEGADLLCGGLGRPKGLDRGFYVQPTLFGQVSNTMRIAREEIFGPVLCILPYANVDDAISMANDSPYGLSGAVWAGTVDEAAAIGRRLRTGSVHLNGAGSDLMAPFGGYKQSGNGREWGVAGFEEFLETKALLGIG